MALPVAVIQLEIEHGRFDENLDRARALIRDAVSAGAKLVVLPETCSSDLFRGAEALAQPIPGPATEAVREVAGDAAIAFPLLEKASDGRVFSACALVDKTGVIGVARKTHLFRDPYGEELFQDSEVISAGDSLSILKVGDTNVGILLGFDAEFPEAFRTLALRGADLIVAALNCADPNREFLRSMALRNCVPVAAANRLGFKPIYPSTPEISAAARSIVQESRGSFLQRCKGGSVIIDNDGKILASAGGVRSSAQTTSDNAPAALQIPAAHFQEEEILTASFRIEELRVKRLTSPFIAQRRVELYEK